MHTVALPHVTGIDSPDLVCDNLASSDDGSLYKENGHEESEIWTLFFRSLIQYTSSNLSMYCSSVILSVALALCSTGVVAVPAPQVTTAPLAADLAKRATSCTFSGVAGAAAASKSKASCATIVLSSVAVPSGTTLDLTGLKAGTHVVFEGTTTFGYKEWAGPLVSVAGTDVVVTGAAGSLLDGGGSRWWDGEGTNGGKTKPKFFYAHKLLGKSSISNINIKNSPVQVFSINGADGLTLTNVHIDNTAGDSGGGHNTVG
ncbi:Polygalacturonase 1 [Elasticomyces elasticus]|nr:Polygalacturonase 1 [Elasticomyces elasticus]KAK5764235.1 Polygalacturonase 1 [Elasticomyces elasticus]